MSLALEASQSNALKSTITDSDVEMSDGSGAVLVQQPRQTVQQGIFEVVEKDHHDLFSQSESEDFLRRVSVIMSFLSLMDIAPVKAFYLVKAAAQDPGCQQFRDYVLFKQIYSDMKQIRDLKNVIAENSRKHTSSSTKNQSILGSSMPFDSLQWMFGFFTMYSIPFQYKQTEGADEETILHARERNGDISAVVLVQRSNESSEKNAINTILNEFPTDDAKTRLGLIVNSSSLTMFSINFEKQEPKSPRSVSITKKTFDTSSIKDFAQIVTTLERFLALYLGVDSVLNQITRNHTEDDMESSPVTRTYPPFDEPIYFYIDRYNTTLSYVNVPAHFLSDANDACFVKKRSHFCNWERKVLSKLKTHPYIIREIELDAPLDFETTMVFENVRPLNKKLFSLIPTDGNGQTMLLTQQLLNTRFEILRQFIKQALHSIIYCHNNGIAHNNILSRGGTFFLDEQYKLKLMGFEHAVISDDAELRFRDMRHLAIVFAELMFNVQFDVCDDGLTDWSTVWDQVQVQIDKHQNIVENCPHGSPNDKMLYKINKKTKKHMFDLLSQMFHTQCTNYYHTYMYHSYVGMASSVYKEKSKLKLKEKTVHVLHGSRNSSPKSPTVDHHQLVQKWATLRKDQKETSTSGSSRSDVITVQE